MNLEVMYSTFTRSLELETHDQMQFSEQTQDTSPSWLRHGTLRDTNTPTQSGPGSNDNKEVLYNPISSQTGASPSDAV